MVCSIANFGEEELAVRATIALLAMAVLARGNPK
jgi:hypothetical protein